MRRGEIEGAGGGLLILVVTMAMSCAAGAQRATRPEPVDHQGTTERIEAKIDRVEKRLSDLEESLQKCLPRP